MRHVLLVSGLLLGFLWVASSRISWQPYSYDESDYVYAAARGFRANWADSPAQSIVEFARVGLARGKDPNQRLTMSESIRSSGDMDFYRHWHGPMFYYWLMLLSPWKDHEGYLRMGMLSFPVLTFLSIYWGVIRLWAGAAGHIAAILGATLFLWGNTAIRATELAPHQMFALWVVVTLLLLTRAIAGGSRKAWYSAVVTAGLAFSTMEVAFVLLLTMVICACLGRRLNPDWRLTRNSLALFAGTVLAVWPAAFLKLSFVKAYAFMSYLAIFRKDPWGHIGFVDTWRVRLASAPIEWLLIASAVVVWWKWRDLPGHTLAFPWLLYSGLMFAALLRVYAGGPRYMLPLSPALYVFAGIALAGTMAGWRSRWRFPATATACLLVGAGTLSYLRANPVVTDPRPAGILSAVRSHGLQDSRILVPHEDLPTLHLYFPRAQLKGYLEETAPEDALHSGNFDAVLHTGEPVRISALP